MEKMGQGPRQGRREILIQKLLLLFWPRLLSCVGILPEVRIGCGKKKSDTTKKSHSQKPKYDKLYH